MILSCQDVGKSFGDVSILSHISFHIDDYEKVALVGINGAGKTTLLKVLVGEYTADEGVVAFGKGVSYGYLAQHNALNTEYTIYDELLSVKQNLIDLEQKMRATEARMKNASGSLLEELMESYARLTHQFESQGGYVYQSELVGVLKGLGFDTEDFKKPVNTLSGGQKTRVALGKLLLQKPDFIILDEPTNHLDLNSIAWLETYLLNYKGAVLIVSHDRYFLNRVVNKVVEIDHGKATVFAGNYSDYACKKEQLRAAYMNAYINQQREIKHQQEVIEKLRSFNREKSIKRAESREKLLNKIDVLDKPVESKADMHLTLEPAVISGNDVLHIENMAKSFGDLHLFSGLNLDIKRGEHVAIIGDNGTGKTTLLKILNGMELPDQGSLRLGTNVEIGYYDQEQQLFHQEKTLFEEISDTYPDLDNTKIRNTLAAFLFTGDEVFKQIKDLSGGEKGRLALAKLMLSNANFLILDEPTNHLDIVSKEILEQALNSYTGTLLYVSHDRYFINRTASRIVELRGRVFYNYYGNYDYYLEKRVVPEEQVQAAEAAPTESKLDWKSQKEEQAKARKRENDLKKCEELIAELESKIAAIDDLMSDPAVACNSAELGRLTKEQSELMEMLDAQMDIWENLA